MFLARRLLRAALLAGLLLVPALARASTIPFVGTYKGTLHTVCPSIQYDDAMVITISADGSVFATAPARGTAYNSSSLINSNGAIHNLFIQTVSQSRGPLTIYYNATAFDGGAMTGSGANGDISITLKAQLVPLPTVTVGFVDLSVKKSPPADSASVVAGEKSRLVFTRTGDTSNTLSVDVSIKGTAVSGTDFTAPGLGSVVTIPAGATTVKIPVTTISDPGAGIRVLKVKLVPTIAEDPYQVGTPSKAALFIAN